MVYYELERIASDFNQPPPDDVSFVVEQTIIIPTFNEKENIVALVDRLAISCPVHETEILFVDDSDDGTAETIKTVADGSEMSIRLIHRRGRKRVGGLAGAVVEGLRHARSRFVVVMDGDLQHPPELIPALLQEIRVVGVDAAGASRYCEGGDATGLSFRWRRRLSSISTVLAKGLFPRRVGIRCTDPMTGFFGLDLTAVDLNLLRPRGFKIFLELLVRHDLSVREVPFVFGERAAGASKASLQQGLNFVLQLLSLRFTSPFFRFMAVGALGLLTNLLTMSLLIRVGMGYAIAAVLASELTIVTNFLLQERFVFQDHSPGRTFHRRALHSLTINNIELIARLPLLVLLVQALYLPPITAAAVSLGLTFIAKYCVLSRITYRSSGEPRDNRNNADMGMSTGRGVFR